MLSDFRPDYYPEDTDRFIVKGNTVKYRKAEVENASEKFCRFMSEQLLKPDNFKTKEIQELFNLVHKDSHSSILFNMTKYDPRILTKYQMHLIKAFSSDDLIVLGGTTGYTEKLLEINGFKIHGYTTCDIKLVKEMSPNMIQFKELNVIKDYKEVSLNKTILLNCPSYDFHGILRKALPHIAKGTTIFHIGNIEKNSKDSVSAYFSEDKHWTLKVDLQGIDYGHGRNYDKLYMYRRTHKDM